MTAPARRAPPWSAPRRGRWLAALCLLPFALVFFAFQIAPLLWVAVNSLQTADGWSLANFTRILESRFYRQAISHSLQVSLWSSLFGLLIALLGSYSLHRVDSRLRDFVNAFATMTSNFAGVPLAFAFIILLGFNGALTLLLRQIGWIEDFNLYSKTGLIVIYTYFQIPLGVLGVWGATEQKVHLSPAPARKPLWRLVSSGKPSFCRTLAGTDARPSKRMKSSAEKSFSKTKSG